MLTHAAAAAAAAGGARWCRFRVPEDVFEINWVFTDGEGLYENNGGQDFMYRTEVRGGLGGGVHRGGRELAQDCGWSGLA
jgi:hypothetical protein